MSKPTVIELNTLLLALTAKVNELVDANKALADQVVAAHARVDHAGEVFKALRAAVTPLQAKREPTPRIPRAEFDRALADLRAEAEDDKAMFRRDVILERAATLRTMAANTQAAA